MLTNAVFFLLHCGAKAPNYGLVLACFSLSCNPGAISLSRIAFHMESEKHAPPSSRLKLSAFNRPCAPSADVRSKFQDG